jgi:hypothetical protein
MSARTAFYAFVSSIVLASAGSALSQQAKTIVSQKAGECVLSVESHDAWGTLRLRAHHPEGRYCRIGREEMLTVLTAAFSKTDPPRLEGTYTSLSIGRLIDFPWLMHYLVRAALSDTGWDAGKRPPDAGKLNKYVSNLLSSGDLTSQLEAPFLAAGYRITGATVEKVLVGKVRDLPFYEGDPFSGAVPYDAMVWFKLEKI